MKRTSLAWKLLSSLSSSGTSSAGRVVAQACGSAKAQSFVSQLPVAQHFRDFHSSLTAWHAAESTDSPEVVQQGIPGAVPTVHPTSNGEPLRSYRQLEDKEMWHEAWMYEDKFGTAEDPIIVPSLEAERIIGCTDPDDDNLVVWGILREQDGARQFIENGEFYTLMRVGQITKVGDVLDQRQLEAGAASSKGEVSE